LGTTTESGLYKLDVNGTARVQGALTGTVALTSVAGSGIGNDFTTNHTVNTSASYIGTRFLSNVTTSAANTSTIIAQQANIKITSTTNLPSAIQGCQLSMEMNGASGTLGQITGITSGGVVANGATVSNVYHYKTDGMFTPSTGVVNSQYGYYYDELYITPSSRGYAFYSKVNPSGGTLASLTDISIIPASTKGVGISNAPITPAASAILDITSTTKGFLPPRLTTTQRDAIATPATGLQVYNTTTNTNDFYNGSAWTSQSATTTASGTYTPTITANTNVTSASNSGNAIYSRVGNVVTVSGFCNVQNTASGVAIVTISLPIASSLSNGSGDANGTGAFFDVAAHSVAQVYAGSSVVYLGFTTVYTGGSKGISYHFTYLIN
jgi:hypothetical protein